MGEKPFIRIAVLENVVEEQLLVSFLTEHRIPHRIRSFHDTAYDGLYQMQKGWGEVYAPASHQKEIKHILNDIRTQNQA